MPKHNLMQLVICNPEIILGQVWQAGNAVIKAAELAVKNAELAHNESAQA